MPSRSKRPTSKRSNRGKPRRASGSDKAFGNNLAKGRSVEFVYRRLYPLSEADIADIHRLVTSEVAKNKRRFKWYFLSVQLSVLGGFYQVMLIPDPESENTWQKQWLSSRVISTESRAPERRKNVNEMMDYIDSALRNRPAKLLRLRLVFLKNHYRLDKSQ